MKKATQIGVFFDGTGNWRSKDIPKGCESNIAKLYALYACQDYIYQNEYQISDISKRYIKGIGVRSLNKILGGITGLGARRRLTRAYEHVKLHLDKASNRDCEIKFIDVFGFSRGASLARHFVNIIKNLGIPMGDSDRYHEGLQVRFLGLFDTVASFGLPGNDVDIGFDFSVDDRYIDYCVHAVAQHEYRGLFDLQSIKTSTQAHLPEHFKEVSFPGAHSDVGGGYEYTPYRPAGWYKKRIINDEFEDVPQDNMEYEDLQYLPDSVLDAHEHDEWEGYFLEEQPEKVNDLSRIPLSFMYNEIKAAGIPMLSMEQHEMFQSCFIIKPEVQAFYEKCKQGISFQQALDSKYVHDSRLVFDHIRDKLADEIQERTVYYSPSPRRSVWEAEKEIVQGDWDEDNDD